MITQRKLYMPLDKMDRDTEHNFLKIKVKHCFKKNAQCWTVSNGEQLRKHSGIFNFSSYD